MAAGPGRSCEAPPSCGGGVCPQHKLEKSKIVEIHLKNVFIPHLHGYNNFKARNSELQPVNELIQTSCVRWIERQSAAMPGENQGHSIPPKYIGGTDTSLLFPPNPVYRLLIPSQQTGFL
jgi:hypothetical protein